MCSTLNQNQKIDFPRGARVAHAVTGAYIAGFIFAAIDQDRNGLVHTRVGNKIASSPLIGTTTSALARSMHRLRSDCISRRALKGTFARMSNKRRAAKREERRETQRIGIGRDLGSPGGREGGEGVEELNKCLPAEICVPIFEAPEFP